jgi:GxxExxY protein
MVDLIYPNESYKIIGLLFKVHDKLGHGLREKDYQIAIREIFTENSINFKEQVRAEMPLYNKKIKFYYLDFLVENKIIIEIKAQERFYKDNIAQVYSYLKAKDLKLGIIVNFTKRGVLFKRIVNIK